MKLGIFSDIHGNQYAFNEFLKIIEPLNLDKLVFLGDLYGYYYGQNDIIASLCKLKNLDVWLRGNHETIFLNLLESKIDENECVQRYGHCYNNVYEKTSNSIIRKIKSLPNSAELTVQNKKILFCHGTPQDCENGRLYPKDVSDKWEYGDYDVVIYGHTHFRLERHFGDKLLLNPGSLGQPRDQNKPCFVILTLPELTVEFIDMKFDRKLLENEIMKNDPNNLKLIELIYRYE